MRRILYVISALLLLLLAAVLFVRFALPWVPAATAETVTPSPQRLARGKYLAHHVAVCMDCHSQRDWSRFSGPITTGTLGQGGELFDEKAGFPGKIYASNITPAHLHSWTDGEILRALSSGVNKQGHALFPVMPYLNYRHMSAEDARSIVAYLRSLSPITKEPPESQIDFPMNLLINTIAGEASFTGNADTTRLLTYGKYLTTMANCADCHTERKNGTPIAGKEFAGGFAFRMPAGILYSANISPDTLTGIGRWSEQDFINRFKAYAHEASAAPEGSGKNFNTVMPWVMYAGMTPRDLAAIYQYLRTVKPVKNKIVNHRPATIAAL